ncbi:hypothetical protein M440DRAFT_23559, partial [Trichoderma longibrachiatum ATCC 18648]
RGTTSGWVVLKGTFRLNNGSTTVHDNQTFDWIQDCKKEPEYTGTGPWSSGHSAKNGSLGCRNSCDGGWYSNADGSKTWTGTGDICPNDEQEKCKQIQGHYWNALLKVCEPPDGKCKGGAKPNSLGQCAPEPCPDGMAQQQDGTCKKKENECPAGQVRSPDGKCIPGDGQCAKGEVRGKDGTCKRDKGNGEPDEGDDDDGGGGKRKESFSGGDDCNVPPSCSGSPIMCGQARIQWRIDCNTRRNRNIAGGTCATMPVCTGDKCDAMEYTQLVMQWRTACAVEKLSQTGGGGGGGSGGDVGAIKDALTGKDGSMDMGAELPGSTAWANTPSGEAIKPDTKGYGWGSSSCPQPPDINIMGAVIHFDTSPLCRWLSLGGYFVMALAALASIRIIATKEA